VLVISDRETASRIRRLLKETQPAWRVDYAASCTEAAPLLEAAGAHDVLIVDEARTNGCSLPHVGACGRPLIILTGGRAPAGTRIETAPATSAADCPGEEAGAEPSPRSTCGANSLIHRVAKRGLQAQTLSTVIRAALAHATEARSRRDAECRLRSHFESLPSPTWIWRAAADDDFVLIDVNEAGQAQSRGRIRSFIGIRATDFFTHRPDVVDDLRRCLAEQRLIRHEDLFFMRTTQEERYLIVTYAFVPPDLVIGHIEDRTERRRTELALMDRERQFQALFDNAKDAILIANDEGQYVDANPAALALLGIPREQLFALRVHDVAGSDPAAIERAWQQFLKDGFQAGRIALRRADGAVRTVDYSATAHCTPGRHLSILRDVTEREELERQLQHAQRLDSVGRLAGGIAHDFNNLLTAIIGFADLLQLTLAPDDPRRRDIAEIHRASESAAALTRQLLAFSRKQVLQPVVLSLNDHLVGVTRLLRRLLGDGIQVRTSFDRLPLYVTADPTQLQQILLNLAINARDAMPSGGTLELRTASVVVEPGTLRDGTAVQPGAYAQLVVSDTGLGMSADTMAHIFEPFFTTKQRSNGTGLGLPTVYGIVKQSGGYIWVSSEEQVGTSFELLLPASSPPIATQAPAARARATGRVSRATILVVDDDRAIRALATRTLEREGFTVLQASGARAALARLRDQPASLLITDIMMPRTSGIELASRVCRLYPEMRVLFVTGYVTDATTADRQLPSGAEVLPKPFTPDQLLMRVRQLLGCA
jgi:PAS domain S-box-containing protein